MPAGGSRRCSRNGSITGCQALKCGASYRSGADPQGASGCCLTNAAPGSGEVEAQERELRRLSALLVEHQAILRSLPARPHRESPQASPPRDLGQLRHEVVDILSSTVNTARGAETGQVPDWGRPLTGRRDTFEDILTDAEDKVPTTPQRWVQFVKVATSTPILRCTEHLEERTQQSSASQGALTQSRPI